VLYSFLFYKGFLNFTTSHWELSSIWLTSIKHLELPLSSKNPNPSGGLHEQAGLTPESSPSSEGGKGRRSGPVLSECISWGTSLQPDCRRRFQIL